MQSESTYNWETEQWSVPVNAALAKLAMFGKLPVSLQAYFEKSSIPGDATKVK